MITLNNTEYPVTYCATGARGFLKEGYPFHKVWQHFGMIWEGTGFSGKTMTLDSRLGNMPLKADGTTPEELFPACIKVDFFRHGGEMMNAVGLSNFGLEFYLKQGMYQKLTEPFFISIHLEAEDIAGQEAELQCICDLIKMFGPYKAMAIQINYGCPNSDQDPSSFYETICNHVSIVKAELQMPVFVNCNALMPSDVLAEVARVADGLWVGNTIPWRDPETIDLIDWDSIGVTSPIKARGIDADGGLSSHQCLQFTIRKVAELRDNGVNKPIIAGNGIRTMDDIHSLKQVGANGCFVGSIGVVRPRGMREVTSYSNHIFS